MSDKKGETKAEAPKQKQKKHRSPNYPAKSLRRAVERAKLVHDKFKRFMTPMAEVLKVWDLKPQSSAGLQSIAALKAYGLIEVEGEGDARKIRVSDVAHRILLNHEDKAKLLRQAALNPPIHADIWKKYEPEGGLPPDETIRHFLIFDKKFNEESVDGFIATFRDTLTYADIKSEDTIGEDAPEDEQDGNDPMKPDPTTKTINNPPLPPKPGESEYVDVLGEGRVILRMPSRLSPASFQDFNDWIQLILRKAKRIADGGTGD